MENSEIKSINTTNQISDLADKLLERREFLWKNSSKKTYFKDETIGLDIDKILKNQTPDPETNKLSRFFIQKWCAPFLNHERKKQLEKFSIDTHSDSLDRVKNAINSLGERYLKFTGMENEAVDTEIELTLLTPLEIEIVRAEVKRLHLDHRYHSKRYPDFSITQELSSQGIKLTLLK